LSGHAHPPEMREAALTRVQGGESMASVAKDLGVSRAWVSKLWGKANSLAEGEEPEAEETTEDAPSERDSYRPILSAVLYAASVDPDGHAEAARDAIEHWLTLEVE